MFKPITSPSYVYNCIYITGNYGFFLINQLTVTMFNHLLPAYVIFPHVMHVLRYSQNISLHDTCNRVLSRLFHIVQVGYCRRPVSTLHLGP